jgi:hypothetical protein
MDRMHTDLTAASNSDDYSPAIRSALKLGVALLDKYYSLTDNSEVYRIAMGESFNLSTNLYTLSHYYFY